MYGLLEESEVKLTKYFIDGITLKEYCNINGFNYNCVINWINMNKSTPEVAIKRFITAREKPDHYYNIKHFINGIPAVEIARQNNIRPHQFFQRINKLGWDLKKACTYKPMTAKEISLKTGLSLNKIYSLKSQGYTQEQLEDMANEK
jgi:hypothetical protein